MLASLLKHCGCLADSPQSPGLALLAGVLQARPSAHPDVCRYSFGKLEIKGSLRVSKVPLFHVEM